MKSLVLLGAGQSHIDLLSTLAANQPSGVQLTLIAPYPLHVYVGMVASFVAGQHPLEDCLIDLASMLQKAGVRWLTGSPALLDVQSATLRLTDGSTYGFDWLSIDTGALQDRQQIEALMPGAREHGLFVRPLEAFCALWPRVTELATSRALRIAVLGHDLLSIELALAIRQRLPGASVTLVAGPAGLTCAPAPGAEKRIVKILRQYRITVLADLTVGIEAQQVRLASGARLACDVPIVANAGSAPVWLASSALALDVHGRVALDAYGRSVSHPNVFAASDVASRAKPALTENLMALLAGRPVRRHQSAPGHLSFVAYGDRRALLSWRGFSMQGRWVGWLKDWLEKRYIQRYRRD
ncbi:MAG: FAD-dependent oxidoreductase [Comamonadaceae bacterium]|jgi:NADH dehydrogenase FAD-containing subunit